jgi:subtilase family serine protease
VRTLRRLTAVLLATVTVASATSLAGSPAQAGDRHSLPGSHPRWATPANRVAATEDSSKVSFRVYLNLRDQAGAEAAAAAVSTPGSASYGAFLTPEQVRARYAPTAASVDAVRSWLTSSGFTVGEAPVNNLYLPVTGTVARVGKAFGVGINNYRVSGKVVRGQDAELSVPTSVGSLVSGVAGIDGAQNLMKPNTAGAGNEPGTATTKAAPTTATPTAVPPPAGYRNARPCSAYWAQKLDTTDPAYGGGFPDPLPYAPCGYTPTQLRAAYGLSAPVAQGKDGRGTTVAILDAFASPTLYADAAEYARRHDPSHPLKKSQYHELVFPTNPADEPADVCDAAGWYGEQSLDVEAVHATAPGANILYVGASDCEDTSLDIALNTVVSKNLAQVVSNSYGDLGEDIPADEVRAFESIAIQAALQGIGLYFSSGDSGDEVANLGTPSPDFSASSPWVTAVGGTSVGIDKSGKRVVETGWETGKSLLTDGAWVPPAPGAYLYGSGGGTSRLFPEPFYQKGVVPTALARQNQTGKGLGRVVPDISMVGDPNTGMLIGETQTFSDGVYYDEYRIGGTSLSSPLFAGFVAVADQIAGHRHGFINPALYRLGVGGPIKDVVHQNNADVRVDYANAENAADGLLTSVRTFDFPGLAISTTKGYDNVTGLGTPAGAALLKRL